MEIVVEYVLVDNLVIDYLILYLSCKLLRQKVVFWRISLASVLGAGCALITPIMALPTWALILFKLLLGWVMVRVGIKPTTIKKEIISYLTFLGMTAVMGGVCFGIIYMLSGDIEASYLLLYNLEIPVGVILLAVALTALAISKMIKYFYHKKVFNNFVFKTVIYDKGKEIQIDAFLDSGNTLIDPVTNKPIVIIDYLTFNKLYDLPMTQLLTKQVDEIENSHYIEFGTVGKRDSMLIFEIEKMQVIVSDKDTKELKNVALGLSFAKLKKSFECNALLHPMLIQI